jgi:hypothetical protein
MTHLFYFVHCILNLMKLNYNFNIIVIKVNFIMRHNFILSLPNLRIRQFINFLCLLILNLLLIHLIFLNFNLY